MALSGFEDERQAIEARFSANYSSSEVRYDNAPWDPDDYRGVGWVALTIVNGDSRQISLGDSPVDRHPGIIQIQSFTPENQGSNEARIRADLIDPIFKRKEFSLGDSGLIRTRVPTITRVGERDGWYQVNIDIPYIRDVQ